MEFRKLGLIHSISELSHSIGINLYLSQWLIKDVFSGELDKLIALLVGIRSPVETIHKQSDSESGFTGVLPFS